MSDQRWKPGTAGQWVRLIGNALNLSTPLGLAVGLACRCRITAGPRGLILGSGYRPRFPIAGAFTIGNVILTRWPSWPAHLGDQPHALRHEERHTWQWLALGPMFLPAYAIAMGWSWLRTGDRASANVFERLAGLEDGGYRVAPRGSWRWRAVRRNRPATG